MTESETADISLQLIPKPALYLMEAWLPSDLVAKVNAYIDAVRSTTPDHSGMLVGQIRRDPRSAQLALSMKDKVPSDLASVITEIARQYIAAIGYRGEVTPIDIWSVHSYAGDYNPLHDHGGKTFLGLSSILYLKVPDVIAEKPAVPHGGAPKLHMASG